MDLYMEWFWSGFVLDSGNVGLIWSLVVPAMALNHVTDCLAQTSQ